MYKILSLSLIISLIALFGVCNQIQAAETTKCLPPLACGTNQKALSEANLLKAKQRFGTLKDDESVIFFGFNITENNKPSTIEITKFGLVDDLSKVGTAIKAGTIIAEPYYVNKEYCRICYIGDIKGVDIYYLIQKKSFIRLLATIWFDSKKFLVTEGVTLDVAPQKVYSIGRFTLATTSSNALAKLNLESDLSLKDWVQQTFSASSKLFSSVQVIKPSPIKPLSGLIVEDKNGNMLSISDQ